MYQDDVTYEEVMDNPKEHFDELVRWTEEREETLEALGFEECYIEECEADLKESDGLSITKFGEDPDNVFGVCGEHDEFPVEFMEKRRLAEGIAE